MIAIGTRPLKIKFILPSLKEASDSYWRPIKYSLFPPLGLATLAAYLSPDDDAVIVDDHVEPLKLDDAPDIVIIQVYITNAYRAYRIADHYRSQGTFVCLGGLHVTSLPEEAAVHADAIFLGPGEQTFPKFLQDFRAGMVERVYTSTAGRTLDRIPPIRRDLIRRSHYLVPNSIVVTRGCPQHCDFCYKDAFFQGGRGFYTQRVEDALREIDRLPGRHLYFLDDHLLGDRRFAEALFDGMKGMRRLFQGAATVDSILRGDLIERAAEAGLRSIFVGFETLTPDNLRRSNKRQNLGRDYKAVADRLHSLGIMINGSFVFGMDGDGEDVFRRTVDWAIEHGITTATFHIQTPYPGTQLHARMAREGRMATEDWDLYDTRHVVYRPAKLRPETLKAGYDWAYREFYRWNSIARASLHHGTMKHQAKHFFYASGWKKFEPLWDLLIRARQLTRVTPLLEGVLSRVSRENMKDHGQTDPEGLIVISPPLPYEIDLQPTIYKVPVAIVKDMQKGKSIGLIPVMEELSTQAAADMLGVSRQFLVNELEAGKLAFHRTGTHRKVYLKDLLAYQEQRGMKRKDAIRRIAQASEELGIYNQFVPFDE